MNERLEKDIDEFSKELHSLFMKFGLTNYDSFKAMGLVTGSLMKYTDSRCLEIKDILDRNGIY